MNKSDSTAASLFNSTTFHLLILYFVAFFIYSNTFGVPFLFDDEGSIQLNNGVHGLANFFSAGGHTFLPNRVVGYLTFAINYQFGELNVAGFHIVNLAIHITNSFLIYNLIRMTFRTTFLKNSPLFCRSNILAFAVALFFVCHPVQTQAVTYVVQRLTSLTTLFFLATLTLHVKWRLAQNEGAIFLSRKILPFFILSLLTAILAMKTKEIAITLPMIVILYELTFFGIPSRRLIAFLTPLALTFAIIPLTMFRNHKGAGDVLSDVSSITVVDSQLSRWEYLCTQFSVITTYLRLLVFPVNQNLDYDYPLNHTLFEPRAFFSFLLLLVLVTAAGYLYYRSIITVQNPAPNTGAKKSKQASASSFNLHPSSLILQHSSRLIAFGILWFFITLSVESSIIPIIDVIFEHRIYLPSIGFLLALGTLILFAVEKLKSRIPNIEKTAACSLIVVAIIFSGATYARNNVWRNWLTIWSDTVAKSPVKARPHNILGIGYLYLKQYNSAVPEFQTAVRLNPNYLEAWFNLGLVFKNMGQHRESIPMYQKALELSGANAGLNSKIHCEIGVNYAILGDLDKALESFGTALNFDPEFVECRNNYAHVMMQKGLLDAAAEECRKVLQMNPGNQRASQILKEIETKKSGSPNSP